MNEYEKHAFIYMEFLCGRFQEHDMGKNLVAADISENRRSFFYSEGFLLPTRTGR